MRAINGGFLSVEGIDGRIDDEQQLRIAVENIQLLPAEKTVGIIF